MKKCPTCDKTFEDSMRFCQTDGTPLVGDDGDATLVQGPSDDLLDVPAAPASAVADREEPLMEIPGFESDVPKSPDFSTPPPSPYSTPEPESSYQSAQTEEIRSTFGQGQTTEWTPSAPAPVSTWQSDQSMSGTPVQAPSLNLGNKNQTLSIVSMVLGIAGLTVCCGAIVPSIAAIITGFMARNKAKSDPTQFGGEGLAMAGIITGFIGLIGGVIILVLYMGAILASIAGGGNFN